MAKNSLVFKIGADFKQFRSAMQNVEKSMVKTGKKMQSVGKSMSTYMTAPLLALGAASVKTFSDFEQEMLKVKAVSGATEQQFSKLTESAKRLGASTRFAASEVSTLQLNYSKLGFAPEEINKVTEATLDLALATGEDLAESATVAASTLRGFGLDASEMGSVVDVMAKSFSSSALDLEKFKTSMGTLAPVAKNAGVSLEKATSFLSILTDRGVDASTAGSGLRNMFLDLSAKGLTLEDALNKINSSSNKNATALELFGKRGATVASIMAENSAEAKTLELSYINSAGAAKGMAEIMDSGLNGSMLRLKSATESMAISFGEVMAPAVSSLAGLLSGVAEVFGALSSEVRTGIVVIVGIVAAIGPLLLLLGSLLTLAPVLGTAIAALGAIFSAATWQITLTVSVIAALVAAGVYMADNWAAISQRTAASWVTIKNAVLDGIADMIMGLGGFVSSVEETFGISLGADAIDGFVEKLRSMKEPIPEVTAEFGSFSEAVIAMKDRIVGALTETDDKLLDTKDKTIENNNLIVDSINGVASAYGRAGEAAITMSSKSVEAAVATLESSNTTTPLLTANQLAQSEAVDETANKITILQSVGQKVGNTLSNVFQQMGDSAKSAKEKLGNAVLGMIKAFAAQATAALIASFITVSGPLGLIAAAAAPALVGGLIGAIPAFANGGLVFGPTMGMVGEGSGTSMSNPEVIAPLDKLKGFIADSGGGVTNNITLEGILKGEDIYLSNKLGGESYANLVS